MPRTAPHPATPARPAVPDSPSQTTLLSSLSLTMLLASSGTSMANVALPTLAEAFSASFQAVQWVVLAYLLTITVVVVSAGRLGDLWGRRRLMLVGLAVFTLGSLACGAAGALWQLIAARVVQGLGAAVMMAITLALAMSHRALPLDHRKAQGVRLDYAGTVLLAFSLAAYSLAMAWGRGAFSAVNAGLLFIGLAGGAAFVVVQGRVAAPLVRLEMFRQRAISTGFATSALVTTVVMATLVVGPFFLAGALGLASTRLGLVMAVGPGVAALVAAPVGRWVDRAGPGRVGMMGLATMLVGTIGLPIAAVTWGVAGYVTSLGFITAGYASFQAANNTAVMSAASADQRGLVGGLLNLSRNLGLITGASVMGAVFSGAASAVPGQDLATGLFVTFLVGAALVAVAMMLSIGTGNSRPAPVK